MKTPYKVVRQYIVNLYTPTMLPEQGKILRSDLPPTSSFFLLIFLTYKETYGRNTQTFKSKYLITFGDSLVNNCAVYKRMVNRQNPRPLFCHLFLT